MADSQVESEPLPTKLRLNYDNGTFGRVLPWLVKSIKNFDVEAASLAFYPLAALRGRPIIVEIVRLFLPHLLTPLSQLQSNGIPLTAAAEKATLAAELPPSPAVVRALNGATLRA